MPSDDTRYVEMDGLGGLDCGSNGHQGRHESAAAGGFGDEGGAGVWKDESPARAAQPFRPLSAYRLDGMAGSYCRSVSMSDKDRRQVPGNERMKRRSSLDAGFDRYLSRQLHEIYDPVLNEAIPDEIAALLDEFDQRPNGQDKTPESD